MKHLFLNLGLLIAASLACASARAACSHTVADLAVTSTIVVIAGPNETCEYHDNNSGNWRLLSIAGVVVPSLGGSEGHLFYGRTVAYYDHTMQKKVDFATCAAQGLTCIDDAQNIDVEDEMPLERFCSISNGPALTATATCLFYAQGYGP